MSAKINSIIPFSQRLSFQQGLVITFIALIVEFCLSLVHISMDYFSIKEEYHKNIEHTLSIAKQPAGQAVYEFDERLAREITTGLFNYQIFSSIVLKDQYGIIMSEREQAPPENIFLLTQWLASWLFSQHSQYNVVLDYGSLQVDVDTTALANSFLDRSTAMIISDLLRVFALALLLLLVFHSFITQPLTKISNDLGSIDATKPEKVRINIPKGHERNELGQIVKAANMLLSAIADKINEVHKINEKLEERVAQRTEELGLANNELQKTNQRLLFFIQEIPLAYIEWDQSFNVLNWNPAAETIFGYSAKEITGHNLDIIIPESARPHVNTLVQNLLQQKGGSRSMNTYITKDQSEIICDWYNTTIVDGDGGVMGCSLANDVTERIQAEEQIRSLNESLKAENVRMRMELEVTRHLQQMVLPNENELRSIEQLDIIGFMEPADEVGGDYYEILNHNGRIKIGIGDVTGHGLESGVLMLMVQTTVRTLLLAGIDNPEQFLNILNQTIYHNAQRMGTDKNLTLSLLDYQKGTLQLTGQHEDVLLVRQNGQVERIDTFDLGFMIGIQDDILKFSSHQEILLQPGDGIVLYTDGITEARNLEGALYGIDRLSKVVTRHWSLTAQEIQQAVIADVKQYIGTQKVFDDITLLVLKQR